MLSELSVPPLLTHKVRRGQGVRWSTHRVGRGDLSYTPHLRISSRCTCNITQFMGGCSIDLCHWGPNVVKTPGGSGSRQNADLPRKIWALGPIPFVPRCFNCYRNIGRPTAAASNSTSATLILVRLTSQEQLKLSILGFPSPQLTAVLYRS